MNIDVTSKEWLEEMKNREIIYNDGGYDIPYIDTLRAVQYTAFLKGFDITLRESEELWSEYSNEMFASFMGCDLSDTEKVWSCIKKYFPEPEEDTIEYLNKYSDNTEYIVEVNIYERPQEVDGDK